MTPRRNGICPKCGKRGIGVEKMIATPSGVVCVRECRYCPAIGRRWLVGTGRDAKFTEVVWS